MLDYKTLADPEVRRAALVARDMPMGLGDMAPSLYLLCRAIRERSTVALSGESADEIFGGYKQFHDPVAPHAHTFPWLAVPFGPIRDSAGMLRADVDAVLDPGAYRREAYESAIAEVVHLD